MVASILSFPSAYLEPESAARLLTALHRAAPERELEAGAELVLLPPLVRSVILNGGLRCASNQVRAPEALPGAVTGPSAAPAPGR